jgi:hypothetical protein
MKKSILVFVVACVSAATLSGRALGQGGKSQPDLASSRTNAAPGLSANSSDEGYAVATEASAVNRKAVRDFQSRCAEAKDEKWYSVAKGFVVHFMMDGFRDRLYYDKKGHWMYSLRYIDEKKLPREVRNQVKSVYFDFDIKLVEIVEVPDHKVYLIHLEDATVLKIIRVSDEGEMDLYKEFTKS